MKKSLYIAVLIFSVLFIVLISFIIHHNDSTSIEIVERNGQSYSPFTLCAEELGYTVRVTKKEQKTFGSEKTTEYQYYLENNDGLNGSLSIAVCSGQIVSIYLDGTIISEFHLVKEDVIFFNSTAYIPTHIFLSLQKQLSVA